MAFEIRGLSVLAYAQGFTLWHYKTSHTREDVRAAGFFAEAKGLFSSGDMVMVSAADGGGISVVTVGQHGVALAALG